jgi:DNA gyrase/topoisomerase IV subunit B
MASTKLKGLDETMPAQFKETKMSAANRTLIR